MRIHSGLPPKSSGDFLIWVKALNELPQPLTARWVNTSRGSCYLDNLGSADGRPIREAAVVGWAHVPEFRPEEAD